MSAGLTFERVTYECRPYSEPPAGLGRVYCGGCLDPMSVAPCFVKEATVGDDLTCATCGKHARDWPVFTNTGIATIEHTTLRIF